MIENEITELEDIGNRIGLTAREYTKLINLKRELKQLEETKK